ncbi:hypothetical protein ACIGW0_23020 [Streptomyces bikiniensis]|uniref:Uncharacterized protein n=1 Tax=Streptomyces bikiniensis TaxID=1896 RepID=A0ABW8D0Z6_STRBI
MRSARILFAATATAAALAITTPGAYALTAGDDWSKDDSAHSQKLDHGKKDHDKDEKDHGKPHGGMHTGGGALTMGSNDEWSKEHHKAEKHEKDHGKPQGGVHTGGGALTLVNADDWSKPESESKPEHKPETKDHEKDWGKEHDKPTGGMHTGGGGLAGSGTNVTGAVVLAGGVAAFVLYRRKKAAGTTA